MTFSRRTRALLDLPEQLLSQANPARSEDAVSFTRRERPLLTAAHAPVIWRYDLNEASNLHLLERMSINAAFNARAIHHDGKVTVCVRLDTPEATLTTAGNNRLRPVMIEANLKALKQMRS